MDNRCPPRYFNLLIRNKCNFLRWFEMALCLACLIMGIMIWQTNVHYMISLIITVFPFFLIIICFFDVASRLLRNPMRCVLWIIISLAAFLALCLCAGLLLFLKRSTKQNLIVMTAMIYLATALVFLFDYAWTACEYCRMQDCCKVEIPQCAQPCGPPCVSTPVYSVPFSTVRPFPCPSVCSIQNPPACSETPCPNQYSCPRQPPNTCRPLRCNYEYNCPANVRSPTPCPNQNAMSLRANSCLYSCQFPRQPPNANCPACGARECNCNAISPCTGPTNYCRYPKKTTFQTYQAAVKYNSAFPAKEGITSIRPVEERFLQLSSHKSSGRSKNVADQEDKSIFSFCGNRNKSEEYQLPQFKNKLDDPSNLDSKLKRLHCTRLDTVSEKDSEDLSENIQEYQFSNTTICEDKLWECPYCKMNCRPEPIDFSLQPSTSLDNPNVKIVRKDIRNNKVHPSPSNQEQKQTLACSKIPRPLNWWRSSKVSKTITKGDEYCPSGGLTYRLDKPAVTTYIQQETTPKRSVSHYSSREHVNGNKSGASTKRTLVASRPSSTNLVYSNNRNSSLSCENRPPRGASICCRCATKPDIRLLEEGPVYVCCTCGKCR